MKEHLLELRDWWRERPYWLFNRPWWMRIEGRPLPPGMGDAIEATMRGAGPELANNVTRNNALLERLKAQGKAIETPTT